MDKINQSAPLVSIIFPVKNGEKYLAEAIESIFVQDYEKFEIIFIDGNSTDRTASIAKSFTKLNYQLQSGKGVANAWNQGIGLAKGEIIAFQACDDIWADNKLSQQVKVLLEDSMMGYNIGHVKFQLGEGELPPPGFRSELLNGNYVGRTLENMVARKSLFEKVGLFNEELTTAHDVEWFVRCKDHKIVTSTLPEVLLTKIIHNNNTTFSEDPAVGNSALLHIFRQSIKKQQNNNEGE